MYFYLSYNLKVPLLFYCISILHIGKCKILKAYNQEMPLASRLVKLAMFNY
jgi:hypothetical protein